ncbi:hypothetical protein CMI45_03070 [Candidatus Pacearchaeota archaeon]|nr:hypothetical protein [Candidatus Pacearchaeota archaeon]|tara:strand:+ start:83 stop:1114 length:1032 start_codon:yes stop_codon:yes gene_type:complete
MELNDKDIKKLIIIGIILLLAVLVFYLIRPIALTIIGGLILAYIFLPLYKKIDCGLNKPWLSAAIVTAIAIILLILPLWFFIPVIMQQLFQMFLAFQNLNISSFITSIFPTASEQFITQTSLAFDSFASKSTAGALGYLTNIFLSFPTILLHVFLTGFVFFFSLRDGGKLRTFLSEISPFNPNQNKQLHNQFKLITDSIVYGQVVIGIVQGIIAGILLLIFNVPNPLVLTLLAIILGIIPVIGPGFIYIPVTIYLFATGQELMGVIYLLANIIFVTLLVESVLRTYIIAKRSENPAILLFVGMIGGLFIFGPLGLILGPLILVYFITFLKAYREKTVGSVFKS